jgi:dihydrofolate synthase/folylpolyglutamate synthase
MNFPESLDYLYGLQQFGIKLGLENIRELLERLGGPQGDYRIVHVAGTNGKGSVCACLAEILKAGGYRVGLYTSPHLHSFTERIRVNGRAITESEVARLTAELRLRAEGIPATFFEFTTALALHHFRRRKVDFAILEVGMGGRLDATNAVTPLVSVITPVCRDHARHLGSDLSSIAREKGGIIKPGIPVVVGPQPAEALAVLEETAAGCRAPLLLYDRDFTAVPCPEGGFSFHGTEFSLAELRPALPGNHQARNLSLALAVGGILRSQGVNLPEGAMRAGVERVRWPGRLEWWEGGREILLDGAHNEGGAAVLAEFLRGTPAAGVRWVVGIKGDKFPADVLGPLLPLVRALYCTSPPTEEVIPTADLVLLGRQAGVAASSFTRVGDALEAALAERGRGEIVLVAGSLFLVAAAREWLQRRFPPAKRA